MSNYTGYLIDKTGDAVAVFGGVHRGFDIHEIHDMALAFCSKRPDENFTLDIKKKMPNQPESQVMGCFLHGRNIQIKGSK